MRKLFYISIAGILALSSCSNEENKQETVTTPQAVPALPPSSKLDEANTQQLLSLVNVYYELKDALVATNAAKADEAATKLKTTTASVVTALKADSANYPTLQPYFDTLTENNQKILSVKDETCEVKRVHFEKVSDAIYGIVKTAGLKNVNIYREYCPMAFNDKGAYWLSNDPEIKNPYFGKKMLECGEVTDSLK